MAGRLAGAVAHAWRDPRGAMARQVSAGLSESRALAHLLLACALLWLASVPQAMRAAGAIDVDDPLSAALAAHLFGYLVVAPLMFYGLAVPVHLAARALGGRGGFLGARSALFWSLLVGAPLALLLALLAVAAPGVPWVAGAAPWFAGAALAFWFWLLASAVAEVEGIRRAGSLAAGFGASFALVAVVVSLLLPGAPAAP
jgi:hypothetical protein